MLSVTVWARKNASEKVCFQVLSLQVELSSKRLAPIPRVRSAGSAVA